MPLTLKLPVTVNGVEIIMPVLISDDTAIEIASKLGAILRPNKIKNKDHRPVKHYRNFTYVSVKNGKPTSSGKIYDHVKTLPKGTEITLRGIKDLVVPEAANLWTVGQALAKLTKHNRLRKVRKGTWEIK